MFASKKYVDETLKKYNLVANKALGQNFLVEQDIALEIVDNANIDKDTFVIEIGPGLGALSEIIVDRCAYLKAFEIDANMARILNESIKNDNFEVINIDFLKVDLDNLINSIKHKKIVVISNLPYYITSKLLNKLLINDYRINTIVAMMQKEVGKKIYSPNKKDINQLSAILSYQYYVSIVKYVGKNSYLPRPEIDSIVLKFEKVSSKYDVSFEKLILLTNYIYATRRKTVYNNLKPLFNNQEKLIECLKMCNIDTNMHIEQLNMDNIVDLCKYI